MPAAQDIVLREACGLSSTQSAATSATFIGAGVLTGLALSRVVRPGREETALLGCFAACAAATLALAYAVTRRPCTFAAVVALMGVSGAASIGFVGVSFAEAAYSAGPTRAAAVYSGGCIELCIQVTGAAITQAASNRRGFLVCATAQCAAFLALALTFRCVPRKVA